MAENIHEQFVEAGYAKSLYAQDHLNFLRHLEPSSQRRYRRTPIVITRHDIREKFLSRLHRQTFFLNSLKKSFCRLKTNENKI